MNNDLEQFSEELLKFMIESDHAQTGDVSALARIALAVKQAKPAYWITYYPNPDPNEFDDREHSHSGAKSCAARIAGEIGGFIVPVYHGTPQPAHTEQVNYPMQPLHIDQFGTLRFKTNPIVQHLLDVAGNVGVNMNTIAMQGFEPEDRMQFAQPIGYSLSGYGELSYVTDESYYRASAAAPKPESEDE